MENKSITEQFNDFKEQIKKLNGASIIITNDEGHVLIFRSKYGEKKFMLPGGGIERNELPIHAAVSELEEECGIIVQESNAVALGELVQRIRGVPEVTGFLFLYHASVFSGIITDSDEGEQHHFAKPEDILLHCKDDFYLSYRRIVAHYLRWKQFQTPIRGRLSDPVDVYIADQWIQV